jgi:N-acetylneuraminic acid mutarotase
MKKHLPRFGFLFLLMIASFIQAQGTWTQKTSMLGTPRYDFTGCAIGSKGYAGTGTHGGLYSFLSDWQEFDPVANTWTQVAPLPYPFKGCTGFEASGYGYVTGGVNDAFFNYDTYEYNALGNNWSTVTPFPNVRLIATGISAIAYGFIVGGYDVTALPMNDAWMYSQPANTWTQMADLPLSAARYYATGFFWDNLVYVFGGNNGMNSLNDLWALDPVGNTWAQKTSLPGTGRSECMSFMIGDKAYIVGGLPDGGGPAMKEVWEYTPATDSWLQLPDFPGANAPAGGVGFTINGMGYIVCGYTSTECWEFDPPITATGEPLPATFTIYPNPVSDIASIQMSNPFSGTLTFTLTDPSGRTVMTRKFYAAEKQTFFRIPVGTLSPGLYIIRAVSDNDGVIAVSQIIKTNNE